ncbi:MAG: 4-hydroxythreonine-4-phosphate dehydrogenase PdxA [Hyphomicrobium sp.]
MGRDRARRPLALTMGDPAGIGPEITLRAWLARTTRTIPPFAVFADPADIERRAAGLGIAVETAIVASPVDAMTVFDTRLPIIAVPLAEPSRAGKPSHSNASAIIASIDRSVAAVAASDASAIVTCPIAKSVLYGAGFQHPGHTEYLAHLARLHWGGDEPRPVMMLAGGGLRVVPLTIHVPLQDVPRLVTTDLVVQTCLILAAALRADFGIPAPRIAVAGLNPHAGEGGAIGREDADVIAPAVSRLTAMGLDISGPHPADTMFHAAARGRYDAAVAMYHDQALIPIKTLAFDTGVNVTLGLPFVRTSPDHGTAFDIATKGVASAESLIAALQMAADMCRHRAAHVTAPRAQAPPQWSQP